ncbi:sensor domain-containing diguanylate cyclase [Oryzibacter oryziterrae]|uniref:sensor domain-containing diguanylate cyclase n=1 Tax=Oryzibacter oryziterrae TaxID=2766474 RepID=UPI001F3C76D2|nr:diguanylate cyclase [Oryzibacter oryziterrae]
MYQSLSANRQYLIRIILPVAGLLAALLIGITFGLFTLAEVQTSAAIAEQVKLANGAIRTHGEYLETGAVDYGHWDEAVENIVTKFDFDWADGNIGMSGQDNYGLSMVFVLGADNSTVYSRVDGVGGNSDINSHLTGGFQELLNRWRKGDDHLGSVSGLMMADGTLAMVAIAPLRPYEDTATKQYTGYGVVFVDKMDDEMLGHLAHDYLLPGLHLDRGNETGLDLRASIALSQEDPSQRFRLVWTPNRPGDTTLRTLGPAIGLIALCFCLLSAFVMRHVMSTFRQLKDSEARAMHDILTGLPNRQLLFDRLDRLVGTRRTVRPEAAVLYLDLDGFKAVNDTLGHDAGDAVLLQVAERMRDLCRDRDTVARLGGDEFAMVMPGVTTREAIERRATEIITRIAEPFHVGAATARVGVSIGAAISPHDGTDCAELLRKADVALYDAKSAGKGVVRFFSDSVSPEKSGKDANVRWVA